MVPYDLSDYARQAPHRLALVEPNGRHWSRAELQLECERLARGLEKRAVVAGECITLALPNCAEFIALALAAARIGCELQAVEADSETVDNAGTGRQDAPGLIIVHESMGSVARTLAARNGAQSNALFAVGAVSGFQPYRRLLANDPAGKNDDSEGPRERPSVSTETGTDRDRDRDNVHYCGLSLADRGARETALDALNQGHTVILAGQWRPLDMLRDIARYRVTASYMLPRQFTQLLALPPETRAALPVSSMRHIICPVTPCPEALRRAMEDWWGIGISGPGALHPMDRQSDQPPSEPGQDNHPMIH